MLDYNQRQVEIPFLKETITIINKKIENFHKIFDRSNASVTFTNETFTLVTFNGRAHEIIKALHVFSLQLIETIDTHIESSEMAVDILNLINLVS